MEDDDYDRIIERVSMETELAALRSKYASAVEALQHYAAMEGALGWPARNTLTQLGEPVEP